MQNRFLTPSGEIYKRQELTARYERTTLDRAFGMVAPAQYTWTEAQVRTGSSDHDMQATEWRFARGTSFRSPLFCAENEVDDGPSEGKRQSLRLDVAYPSLPKSPAVNLLRVLSWDVVTFEMLVSHVGTLPNLSRIGATATVDRISNTWGALGFSEYAASSSFKNGVVSATLLGYTMWLGHACAIYSFECDRSELDVHADPGVSSLAQRGSSFYSGKLLIDVERGDLVAGDMVETIIALVTKKTGETTSVQKQRLVHIAYDQQQTVSVDEEASAAYSVAGVTQPRVATLPARAVELSQTALEINQRFEVFIKEHLDEFQYLPEGLKPLSEMGYHSFTGNSLEAQVEQAVALSALLGGLRHDTDGSAIRALQDQYPALKRSLEGFVMYAQVAPDEAEQLELLDDDTLHTFRSTVRSTGSEVTTLLATIDELLLATDTQDQTVSADEAAAPTIVEVTMSPTTAQLSQTALEINQRFEAFIKQHRDEFQYLPEGLKPLAEMGYQSFTGNSLDGQVEQAAALSTLLDGLRQDADGSVMRALQDQYPAWKRSLEGFVMYAQSAPAEAEQLELLDDDAQHTFQSTVQSVGAEVTTLLATIDDLLITAEAAAEAPPVAEVMPPATDALPAQAAELSQTALEINQRFEAFIKQHRDEFQYLPEGLKPLAEMGYQSFTGNSLDGQVEQAAALSALLDGLRQDADGSVMRALQDQYPAWKRSLEGFVMYAQSAPAEAEQLELLDDDAQHTFQSTVQSVGAEVTTLLATIDELLLVLA